MTLNICMQKKIPKFCAMCEKFKIVMYAKSSCFTVDLSENMFFILKNQAKT